MISHLIQDTDKKILKKTRRYFEKQGNFSIRSVLSSRNVLAIPETGTFGYHTIRSCSTQQKMKSL
jgi:hypothetical protein